MRTTTALYSNDPKMAPHWDAVFQFYLSNIVIALPSWSYDQCRRWASEHVAMAREGSVIHMSSDMRRAVSVTIL